jgi:hypothetical protein
MIIVITKFFFSILGILTAYILLKTNKVKNIKFYQFITFGFFTRWVILLIWFYFLGGEVSGDNKGYLLHVNWVLEGRVPNRDFSTPYGFYFSYILSAPYYLFKNPAVITFTVQVFELMGFCLFYLSIKKLLSVYQAKLFALLYLTNPLVIGWFAFDGQDESMMIFAFGGIFYAAAYSNRFLNYFFSCFSIFAVKITAFAAVLSVILVSNRKEILQGLLFGLLFLLIPLFLNSKIFGFQFEWENDVDILSKHFFPGNIWFLINDIYQTPRFFSIDQDKNLILFSRLTTMILFLMTTYMLLKSKNLYSKPIFIALGASLYTLSFQIGSIYVSPGFIATIIPFLIFLLLTSNNLINRNFYFFMFYSLIIPFDLAIYLIWEKNYQYMFPRELFNLIFYPYELLIISSNILLYFILIKFLFKITKNHNLIKFTK